MLTRTGVRVLLSALVVAVAAPAVDAQEPATSLDQLRVLVKPGDTVTVTDETGRETRGKIASLTQASLELAVDGGLRSFAEGNVRVVRQRRPDSLRNGVLWGLGAGAAFGAIGFVEGAEVGVASTALYAGIGVGIGVGIDAALKSTQTIFFNPARTQAGLTLRPVMSDGRVGMSASLSF
ncbi:MAG TPA: hypothetical protein VFO67_20705 [Gemmatimonadales bacterium]|nr:hypothetical protein [Gemmatimonadales bacterium]